MKPNPIRPIHWAASVPADNAAAAGDSHRSQTAKTKFALLRMPLRLKFRRTLPIVALTIVNTLAAGNALGATTVSAWGSNSSGQTNVPANLTNVLAIAPGSSASHILALRADGTVVAWGNNSLGQTNVPASLSNVVAVAVGLNHSLALKADGTVAAWGDGAYGQLNVPPDLTNAVAVAAGGYHNLALKRDKTVVAWGANSSGQTAIPAALTNVLAVAGGNLFSMALKADGTVVAWGDNSSSQTNVPADLTNAVAIAAGWIHSLALRADGTVVGWGENSSGQTTVPAGLTNAVAIAAGGFHSLALKADKTVVAWGASGSGQTIPPTDLTNVTAIAGGQSHSLALVGTSTPTLSYKANNTIPLNQAASWTNNAVPDSTEFGVWSSIVTAPMTNELGADMTWGGIRMLSPGGPVTLTPGNALTLNGVSGTGIDMSNATQDLTLNCGVTVASNQTWNIASSRTLAVDTIVVTAPLQVGGGGYLRNNTLHGEGVYPVDFVGSSATLGSVEGVVPLLLDGPGTVSLTGSNSSSGPITVNAGTLQVQANANNIVGSACYALGSNTLTLAAGGALELLSDSPVSYAGGGAVVPGGGTVRLTAAPVTPGVSNQMLTFGTAGLVLTNTTLVLLGTNGYGVALGPCACYTDGGPVRFNSLGTIVQIAGVSLHSGPMKGVYPVDFQGASYGSPSEIEWDFGRGSTCGTISGTGPVVKDGPFTLALVGNNSYSGSTTISNGTLALLGNNSGVSGATFVGSGARVVVVASDRNTVGGLCYALASNPVTLADGAALQLRADSRVSFAAGPAVVPGGTVRVEAAPVTLGVSNQTLAFGAGGLSLTNATLTVTNVNGYGVSLGPCACDLSAGPVTFNSLGTPLAIAGVTLQHGLSKGVYPIDFTGASYGSPSEIEWNFGDGSKNIMCGPIGGSGSVHKGGNNVLLLSGANTYSGSTEIGGGVLVINGTMSGGSAVTVSSGILSGYGLIGGPVTVQAGGMLSPGGGVGGIGTLAVINTLTLAAGSTTLMQLNKVGGTNDQVRGITTLTYSGTLLVTNLAGTLAAGDSFKLFDAAHYIGSFAAISPTTPGSGMVWDSSHLPVDGTLRVAAVPPERPPIQFAFTGGLLVLAWPSGCTLQSANSLLGPWSAVPGAVSPYSVIPTDPTKFYRLVCVP